AYQKQIDLSNHPSGIYLLTVKNSNQQLHTKLVNQK
ncbi:MAG: T9SS type A sorting domain-containing protein, partial [Bacteroidia bacterium]